MSVSILVNFMEFRINRYIMECKFIRKICIVCCTFELIDTLWNVNETGYDKRKI